MQYKIFKHYGKYYAIKCRAKNFDKWSRVDIEGTQASLTGKRVLRSFHSEEDALKYVSLNFTPKKLANESALIVILTALIILVLLITNNDTASTNTTNQTATPKDTSSKTK